jgi:hypothetical protein
MGLFAITELRYGSLTEAPSHRQGQFKRVIEKAMEACRQPDHEISDHFSQTVKMVNIG